jgi:glutamate--cysteine ligase catalytic subunit
LEAWSTCADSRTFRRQKIASCLKKDERVLTLANLGLLGSSRMKLDYKALITDKQRYQDMISRIPERVKTASNDYGHKLDSRSVSSDCEEHSTTRDDMIHGWGGCGLQVTFSANNLQQVCRLHDQLVPLGPLMLALSAATPLRKGRLVATDTRWEAMCRAGDDRKPSEIQDIHPRLGCTPMYLEESSSARRLNDRTMKSIDGLRPDLRSHGVPPSLAVYLSHVLNRDPLIDAPHISDGDDTSTSAQSSRVDLMNLHMSTWWPHVRLKLPVVSTFDKSLPWRVEFRPMDAQPSDMENASLVVAMRILQQTIDHFDLDLRIPISAVEENMNRANARAAATDQVFRFAAKIGHSANAPAYAFDGWASLDTIFNGGDNGAGVKWLGLLPLAHDYLAQRGIPELPDNEQERIFGGLELLSARASGRVQTPAKWMRSFISKHSHSDSADDEISAQVYYAMIMALSP